MNDKNFSKNKLHIKDSGITFDVLVMLMLIFSLLYGLAFNSVDKNTIIARIFSFLCAPLSVVGTFILISFRKKQNVLSTVLPKKSDKNAVISLFLITFGMAFGLSELNNIFVTALQKIGFTVSEMALPEKSFINVTAVIIFVCIIPAFFEEIVFRGLILKGLINGGKIFSILLSGALFSLFHMSYQQTIYQFIVGVLYALIVLSGGDWSLTFISHLINNLFIVLNYYFIGFYPEG
ncbi:MAG: CPBP family intramembrane metalloprotease, partial [Clostridia bacterium]|nr:CPBP family intramembrane metalloprotease [Clostridia bacterium]